MEEIAKKYDVIVLGTGKLSRLEVSTPAGQLWGVRIGVTTGLC